MDDLLVQRIRAALDEAQDRETRQDHEKMVREGKAEEAAEQERQERMLRALEMIARAFDRMSETLQAIRCSGLPR